MNGDVAFLPALEQAKLVRQRKISPVELVDFYLDRIDRLDSGLNSYITVAADQARIVARRAESEVGDGHNGAFHGVPISIKDLHNVAGIRTSLGLSSLPELVPNADDTVVAKLRAAGFIVLGKTSTPALGLGCVSEPAGFPPCRNPWDTSRTPGGSSGGAGAALASGLCAVSQGSDGGGSIRIPASWCGVVGVKPSRGRVSSAPGPSHLLGTNGPLTRTVADAAALLDVMSGPVLGDAFWAPLPSRPFLQEVGQSPGQLRIAISLGGSEIAPENRSALDSCGALLSEMGHLVKEVDPDPTWSCLFDEFIDSIGGVGLSRAIDQLGLDLKQVDPLVAEMIEMTSNVTADAYDKAMTTLQTRARRVTEFFENFDLLVSPTTAKAPPHIGEHRELAVRELFIAWERYVPFTTMWNLAGQPAMSLPAGLDGEGLPLGIQLVARPADEATLFRLGAQLEEANPWHDLRPAVS